MIPVVKNDEQVILLAVWDLSLILLFEAFDTFAKVFVLYQEFFEHLFHFTDMTVVFIYAVIYVPYKICEIRGCACGTASSYISQFQRLR